MRREYVVAHGGTWHDGAQATMIGMRTQEWARYVHDDLGVNVPQEAIAEQVVAQVASRLRDAPILPGATAALERLSVDFRLGLATSAARLVATTALEIAGWQRFFEVVVSADDVANGKPKPDVYLRALELLHADARHAAAVEDSTNGIRSAYAAQLAVIAIPNREFAPDPSALALASRVLSNLDALTVDVVREAIAR